MKFKVKVLWSNFLFGVGGTRRNHKSMFPFSYCALYFGPLVFLAKWNQDYPDDP